MTTKGDVYGFAFVQAYKPRGLPNEGGDIHVCLLGSAEFLKMDVRTGFSQPRSSLNSMERLFLFTLSDQWGEVRCAMLQKLFYAVELGDWQRAVSLLPCAEHLGVPKALWSQVVEALRESRRDEEDLQAVRLALRKAPRCIELYHALARLFLAHRDVEQAAYWWSIGIKIEPHRGLFWLLGGRIALLQDDLEAAEFRTQCAARFLDEEDLLLSRTRGRLDMAKACALWGKGQHEQALFWMRRALRYDPTWVEPWEALSRYLEMLGCKERAAWYASEALVRRGEALLH